MSVAEPTKKTDGADGPPVLPPAPVAVNSAVAQAAMATPDTMWRRDHPCAAQLILDPNTGVVHYPEGVEPRRKIAVCGFASSSRHLMPINDPSWEIWGMNQLYRHIPRGDRWFDIHSNWDQEVVAGTDHRGWARACGIPFYMMEAVPDVATSVRYPIEAMIALAGDYFTSTVAFMTALAIAEIDRDVRRRMQDETFGSPMDVLDRQTAMYGEYTLALLGIDLIVGEEYFHQKACAEFWLGLASGRGILVRLPPQTALCKQAYRYGYEAEPKGILTSNEVREQLRKTNAQRETALREAYMCDGALQASEMWLKLLELRERGGEVRL